MNCFEMRYYQFNRKLLSIFGQWPYQKYSNRVKLWSLYMCIMCTAVVVQVGRVMNAELTFDLLVEFITEVLAGTVMMIRYFTYTVYNKQITALLDDMKKHWLALSDEKEYELFSTFVDESTLFVRRYASFTFACLMMFAVTMISSPLLIYTPFFNETCPILMMYSKDFIVDPHDYCLVLLAHICLVIGMLTMGIIAVDVMYMVIMLHAVGLFKIVCYRLEHVYDDCANETKCGSIRTNVHQRIANAVECHRAAIRFSEDIVKAFEWSNLISLMLTLLSIAVALYWAAVSKGQSFKMVFAIAIASTMMVHLFFMDLPSQTMIDNSEAVMFKAYCGLWYMAPPKQQTLLLLAMQRGLKPCAMVMGKLHLATLENFAAEVQASFSYFTLLLSMQ